jgi:hypothetical protein
MRLFAWHTMWYYGALTHYVDYLNTLCGGQVVADRLQLWFLGASAIRVLTLGPVDSPGRLDIA